MIEHSQTLRRQRRVFSGKNSTDLWKAINKTKGKKKTHLALYSLGCRCQELEEIVRRLESRIARLEDP